MVSKLKKQINNSNKAAKQASQLLASLDEALALTPVYSTAVKKPLSLSRKEFDYGMIRLEKRSLDTFM